MESVVAITMMDLVVFMTLFVLWFGADPTDLAIGFPVETCETGYEG